MNWLIWLCIWLGNWWVVGLNLAKNKFTLFLPNFLLAWLGKGLETLAANRGSLGDCKSIANNHPKTITPIVLLITIQRPLHQFWINFRLWGVKGD